MAKKPLNFIVTEKKCKLGKFAGKTVLQAQPTERERVDFRELCEEIARNTTFSPEEVAAVINLMTKIAKVHVENGESVELGDLGTVRPSFRSVMIEKTPDAKFNAQQHITSASVEFLPSRKYFELRDVNFEQVQPRQKKGADKACANADAGGAQSPGGSSSSDGTPPSGSGQVPF